MASKISDITRSAASGFSCACNRVYRRGLRRLSGGTRSRCSCGAVALCLGFRFQAGEGFLTLDGLHLAAFQFVIAAVERSPRLHQLVEYPANASCKSSSVPRPLCAARSLSLLSTSGVKCTSIAFRVRESLG